MVAVLIISLVTACASEGGNTTTTLAPTTTGAPTTSSTTTPSTTMPQPSVSVENLKLAATWLTQLGDGVAVGVSESNQGTDLNDDGDTDDVVVHVVGDGQVLNTGLEAGWGVEPLDGGGFFMNLHEGKAGIDLNGDGDTDDSVPQVWSSADGVTNVGLTAWATSATDGALWLASWPDSSDELRLWRPDGEIVDTGWAALATHTRDDGAALITVLEEYQGEDLNGDGRLDEGVLVLWREGGEVEVIGPAYQSGFTSDGGVWRTWNESDNLSGRWHLGLWHPEREPVDLSLATVNHTATSDGGLLFRVSESPDYWSYSGECVPGATDMNGDGDCGDFVLHAWAPQIGLVELGLSEAGWCPECDWGYVTSGNLAYVSQPEWLVEMDLNGDGEITDVPVLQLVEGDSVRSLGLDVTWSTRSWAVLEDGVVVLVPESGNDLNGDGDTEDQIFHYVPRDRAPTNLGLGGWLAQEVAPDLAVLLAEESGNGRDLNNDGLISDNAYVIHLWRLGSEVVNTGITNGQKMDEMEGWRPHRVGALPDGRLVALVPEREHGISDLNGDGDLDDLVVHVITASQ